MSGSDAYDDAMPQVHDYLHRYERALGDVRESHAGRPYGEVLEALTAAFAAEGVTVWAEVAADAARRICGRSG